MSAVSQTASPTPVVRERIREVLGGNADSLVNSYYHDAKCRFAGHLFDDFGSNPECEFTGDDLLAASLLDVQYGPRAVRDLVDLGVANALLAGVPGRDAHLWDEAADLSRDSSAGQLWVLLCGIPGIGPTRASKLLARKRPALFPILDAVVRHRLEIGWADAWIALRLALADERLRTEIDTLRLAAAPYTPSTLRLLDVATWMTFSQSRNARSVR